MKLRALVVSPQQNLLSGWQERRCVLTAPLHARAHPRPLAVATPASPGSSAKLFNAVISRRGESSAPGPRAVASETVLKGPRAGPAAPSGGTSEGLTETPLPQASFWEEDGGPGEAWGKAVSPPHTFLSPTWRSHGRNEAICTPAAHLPSGREPPSNKLTHTTRVCGKFLHPGERIIHGSAWGFMSAHLPPQHASGRVPGRAGGSGT